MLSFTKIIQKGSCMTSVQFRQKPDFLRNTYPLTEKGFPIIKAQSIPKITKMLAYTDMVSNDETAKQENILIHFFKDDIKFETLYKNPRKKSTRRKALQLAQYSAVCTPDYSLYPEMPEPIQRMQVFKNRWCGAHWQELGILVIPTISWSNERSFDFCFDGVPPYSTVAISVLGCKNSKQEFILGYRRMLEVLRPRQIICYGEPFDEIKETNVISFPYRAFRKKVSA